MKKLDIIGKTFNDLKIMSENFDNPNIKSRFYNCLCLRCSRTDEVIIRQGDIINGKTQSCGCLRASGPRRIYEPSEATARARFGRGYDDGDLTFEQFLILSQQKCIYCGNKPSNLANRFKNNKQSAAQSKAEGDFIYSGLDRIDSNKLHDFDNVVPCCWNCNYLKGTMSIHDFTTFLTTIHNFQQERTAK